MTASATPQDGAASIIRDAARRTAPDHYLSALLAPRAARSDLLVLAAFAGDVWQIAARVGEPLLAGIRLQWWRDALQAVAQGDRSGHPIADALGLVMARHGIGPEPFIAVVDAAEGEIALRNRPDDGSVWPADGTGDAALFALNARVIGCALDDPGRRFLEAAGEAYGAVRLAVLIAKSAPLAAGSSASRLKARAPAALVKAREAAAAASAGPLLRQAALPVALVEPYLKCLRGLGLSSGSYRDLPPLTRVTRLWLAHLTRRF